MPSSAMASAPSLAGTRTPLPPPPLGPPPPPPQITLPSPLKRSSVHMDPMRNSCSKTDGAQEMIHSSPVSDTVSSVATPSCHLGAGSLSAGTPLCPSSAFWTPEATLGNGTPASSEGPVASHRSPGGRLRSHGRRPPPQEEGPQGSNPTGSIEEAEARKSSSITPSGANWGMVVPHYLPAQMMNRRWSGLKLYRRYIE